MYFSPITLVAAGRPVPQDLRFFCVQNLPVLPEKTRQVVNCPTVGCAEYLAMYGPKYLALSPRRPFAPTPLLTHAQLTKRLPEIATGYP